ncbi:unnamed protein product, partial [Discosporangium mesarthrocarpum]
MTERGGEEAGVDVGHGAEGRRRLSPADLEMQLMAELQLHDDLQDAELQLEELRAAQGTVAAQHNAQRATLQLRRERVSEIE